MHWPVASNSKPWKGHTSRPAQMRPPAAGPRSEPRCGHTASATQTRPSSSLQTTTSTPIHVFWMSVARSRALRLATKYQPSGNVGNAAIAGSPCRVGTPRPSSPGLPGWPLRRRPDLILSIRGCTDPSHPGVQALQALCGPCLLPCSRVPYPVRGVAPRSPAVSLRRDARRSAGRRLGGQEGDGERITRCNAPGPRRLEMEGEL